MRILGRFAVKEGIIEMPGNLCLGAYDESQLLSEPLPQYVLEDIDKRGSTAGFDDGSGYAG